MAHSGSHAGETQRQGSTPWLRNDRAERDGSVPALEAGGHGSTPCALTERVPYSALVLRDGAPPLTGVLLTPRAFMPGGPVLSYAPLSNGRRQTMTDYNMVLVIMCWLLWLRSDREGEHSGQ